jgi:hypothetical protein
MHPRVLLSPRGSARPPPQYYALADEHERPRYEQQQHQHEQQPRYEQQQQYEQQPRYEEQPHVPQWTGLNGRHPRWLANE